MNIRRVEPAVARRQAAWIVGMEPWLSMGFQAAPLGRWLFRRAQARCVLAAVHKRATQGIVELSDRGQTYYLPPLGCVLLQ